MNFDGRYLEWNQKRIKGIIDFYGHKFFYFKKILDLGCGYADISASLLRLGADITAVDARQEHIKIINKKYPEIKTIKADLDKGWPVIGKKYDMVINLDLLCHINNYEEHLRQVCASTYHLVLETTVCDNDDPYKNIIIAENKNNYDLSFNGNGSRPTASSIERILKECGMNFKRLDNPKFNSGSYKYDWQEKNNGECNVNNRRIWFAVRNDSAIQFVNTPIIKHKNINISINKEENKIYPVQFAPNINLNGDKKFVIIIPSYNNSAWCEKNIQSAINQDYSNFRVIFTDDCSSDNTFEKVSNIVHSSNKSNICTLIKNNIRIGALENLYNMIYSCADDEIILTLDGDDWLSDNQVLNKLKNYYSNNDIWMTYGQYQNSHDGARGVAQEYPKHIVDSNNFRLHAWGASHLRTFYAWLFKKIRKEDLFHDGKFMAMTWDLAKMIPMLEMSGNRSKFISETLYIYNTENPINDHKVNRSLQAMLDRYVRSKTKYQKLEQAPIFKKNIGLMFIATGKYDQFLQGIISSADNYFLTNQNVKYYIFTDKDVNIQTNRKYEIIKIEHKPFPFATLDRFKHFTNNSEKLEKEDYLYYCDVDSLFKESINEEILGNLVSVQHCGYYKQNNAPFETNINSKAFVSPEKRIKYFGGGFSGGKSSSYLKLAKICYDAIEEDLSKNIIAIWHDESHINKYFSENIPEIILSPEFHYPQSNIDYYRKKWGNENFTAKILLLDKNHSEIRK